MEEGDDRAAGSLVPGSAGSSLSRWERAGVRVPALRRDARSLGLAIEPGCSLGGHRALPYRLPTRKFLFASGVTEYQGEGGSLSLSPPPSGAARRRAEAAPLTRSSTPASATR